MTAPLLLDSSSLQNVQIEPPTRMILKSFVHIVWYNGRRYRLIGADTVSLNDPTVLDQSKLKGIWPKLRQIIVLDNCSGEDLKRPVYAPVNSPFSFEMYAKYFRSLSSENSSPELAMQMTYLNALNPEHPQSFNSLQILAKAGNCYAHYELGRRYAKGIGVEKDIFLARDSFLAAKRQKCLEADYMLGQLGAKALEDLSPDPLKRSILNEKDFRIWTLFNSYTTYFDYYEQAAKLGHPAGLYCTGRGHVMEGGKIIPRHDRIAELYYQEAASLNYAPALTGLYGISGKLRDLEKAVELGDKKAQGLLGEKLYCRDIWSRDYYHQPDPERKARGLALLETAAERGDRAAADFLYRIYSDGDKGVEKNEEQANSWRRILQSIDAKKKKI